MDFDFEIFKGKSFSGLCKDIVRNSENKKGQIQIIISELRGLIKTVNDAVIIVPLIKEYFDVGIKNDEQIVKLAAIVQKLMNKASSNGDGGDYVLTAEERENLLKQVEEVANTSDE